jgi:hypothetical protein
MAALVASRSLDVTAQAATCPLNGGIGCFRLGSFFPQGFDAPEPWFEGFQVEIITLHKYMF